MIEWGLLAWMSALGGAVAVPTVLATAKLQGWRGRRRNEKGLCGTSLWLVTGLALVLPLIGILAITGVLPFVSGGLTAGTITVLLVPPILGVGIAGFEMRQMRRSNDAAPRLEGEIPPELDWGDTITLPRPN